MTTVVLHLEMPAATDAEVAAAAEAMRQALGELPDVQAVEVEIEGPTRVLDANTVAVVLSAVTIAKTSLESLKLLREYFAPKAKTDDANLARIDPSRLLVELPGGRLVRLTAMTQADLEALGGG